MLKTFFPPKLLKYSNYSCEGDSSPYAYGSSTIKLNRCPNESHDLRIRIKLNCNFVAIGISGDGRFNGRGKWTAQYWSWLQATSYKCYLDDLLPRNIINNIIVLPLKMECSLTSFCSELKSVLSFFFPLHLYALRCKQHSFFVLKPKWLLMVVCLCVCLVPIMNHITFGRPSPSPSFFLFQFGPGGVFSLVSCVRWRGPLAYNGTREHRATR